MDKNAEKEYINISQVDGNFSIESFFPKLIWLEGQLRLNISSNQTGQIYCSLNELSGNAGFSNVNETINLIGNNVSQTFVLRTKPSFLTFPGIYRFDLNITGLYTYNESFEIVLAMGYSLLTIISIAFTIGLIMIIYKHKSATKLKSTSKVIEAGTLGTSSGISGKIKCPECNKIIDEGLTFCPECGARIPEFLRYNPTGM
ncbi:MAG: zinc ribbon domain-containing protein [Candidatus Hodarchaeota archaeon]